MLPSIAPNRTPSFSSKKIFRSKTMKIGITTAIGVGVGIAIVSLSIVYGNVEAVTTITNVGKLLIDTDAGADDAVAILLALGAKKISSNANVVGITCVNGNTYVDNVVLNVLKTLKVVDRLDIPVYRGADKPLLTNDEKTDYFGKDGFGDFDYPDPPSTDLAQDIHAVNAMIDIVKQNPGEVTLLALGPLTNIALAIKMHPPFIDDLKQLIILGGSAEGAGSLRPGVDFNFGIDPAANYIVLNASISKPAILVPTEAADRARTTMAFRRSLNAANPKVWLINSAESGYLKSEDEFWYCADAVAAAVALTSGGIVKSSDQFYLDAVYEGSITAGMIVIDRTNITLKAPNTNLIHDINVEAYKTMLKTTFS